jgi:hypothetical protein
MDIEHYTSVDNAYKYIIPWHYLGQMSLPHIKTWFYSHHILDKVVLIGAGVAMHVSQVDNQNIE